MEFAGRGKRVSPRKPGLGRQHLTGESGCRSFASAASGWKHHVKPSPKVSESRGIPAVWSIRGPLNMTITPPE